MSREGEAYMPPHLLRRVLESAMDDVVLVGGQALAYWMGHYNISVPGNLPAISRDVDFFTPDAANTAPLQRFAQAIDGKQDITDIRTMSALIGSAIAPAEDDRVYNVDLLHAVIGLTREHVQDNAVDVPLAEYDKVLRVMHPLDVLQSRNANLHLLPEKQDDLGRLQLRLAIDVAREYLEEQIDAIEEQAAVPERTRRRRVFDLIQVVDDYSRQDAADKNAERHAIFLADAIPAWRITAPVFWERQWPHLRERMSTQYAAQCEEWPGRGDSDG